MLTPHRLAHPRTRDSRVHPLGGQDRNRATLFLRAHHHHRQCAGSPHHPHSLATPRDRPPLSTLLRLRLRAGKADEIRPPKRSSECDKQIVRGIEWWPLGYYLLFYFSESLLVVFRLS